MRGTLKRIEVERWGSEQARRYQAGSLNPSKTSTFHKQLSGPASARWLHKSRSDPFLEHLTEDILTRLSAQPLCGDRFPAG